MARLLMRLASTWKKNYQVDMESFRSYVKNIFEECVNNGIFEKISRNAKAEERFRIKREENVVTNPKNLLLKYKMNSKAKKLRENFQPSKVKLEKKATICTPTREMLIIIFKNAMKNPNKRDGVSFSEICKYMEENYQIDVKLFNSYVKNVFEEWVNNGMIKKKLVAKSLTMKGSK